MAKKILFIMNQAYNPVNGGVQQVTYRLSSYFYKKGFEVHIFSFQQEGHINSKQVILHKAGYSNRHRNSKNNKTLRDLLKELKPNIVINQKPYAKEITEVLFKSKQSIPFKSINCLHNSLFAVKLNLESYINKSFTFPFSVLLNNDIGKAILLKIHWFKNRKKLKQIIDTCDNFVLFGPPNVKELKYFVGNYKLDKLRCIPNSINEITINLNLKENRVLWLGRLSYTQKRADLIIPLWEKISKQLPNWTLDIVGNGDAYVDIKELIKKKNIPRIHLHGKQIPDDYYKKSKLFIMTSEYEGFPNTLIEAQSFGCVPVIFDNYPMCSWIVGEGRSGLLIDNMDLDVMSKRLISLARNSTMLNALMQASLKNANNFMIDKIGQKWQNLFNSL